jgi:uncharacterized protein
MSSDNTSDEGVPGEGEAAPLDAPKIEFPCLYPIKIIGIAGVGFQQEVIATVEKYAGEIAADLIQLRPSKQQNYLSVRLIITATGEDQLRDIFTDLKTIQNVKMVL